MFEYISVLTQMVTGLGTLAVAAFLASQLRLQISDSSESTRAELTNGISNWISLMISDAGFTNIYLRAIEGKAPLTKDERHRFNAFLVSGFLRIQQLWENDNANSDVQTHVNIMFVTGPGIMTWYQNMGRFVLKQNFVEYVDREIEKNHF